MVIAIKLQSKIHIHVSMILYFFDLNQSNKLLPKDLLSVKLR